MMVRRREFITAARRHPASHSARPGGVGDGDHSDFAWLRLLLTSYHHWSVTAASLLAGQRSPDGASRRREGFPPICAVTVQPVIHGPWITTDPPSWGMQKITDYT